MADKEFNPDEYLAQKEFNPDEYLAEKKGKVTVEGAPEEKESMLPKLGTFKDAAKSAERMAIAVAKPPAAIAEMLGWGAPAKQLLARDEQLKEEAGLGGKASSLAGDVAGYLLPSAAISKGAQAIKAIPEIAKLTAKLPEALKAVPGMTKMLESPLAKTSAAGAASTLLNPVGLTPGEEGYSEERAKQAAVGAVAGPVAGAVVKGAASVMDPALKRIAELRAQGIDVDKLIKGDTTLGQLLGGFAQKAENLGQIMPFSGLGPKVAAGKKELEHALETRTGEIGQTAKTAIGDIGRETNESIAMQRAAIEAKNASLAQKHIALSAQEEKDLINEIGGYSAPVINRSLKAIGQELPEGLTGSAAIKHAQEQISKGYTDELARIGKIPFTKEQKSELAGVLDPKNLKKYYMMDEKHLGILENKVADLQNSVGRGRSLPADQWQKTLQDLGDESYKLRTSPSSTNAEKQLGEAMYELKERWMDILEKSAGSEKFKALNKAHSLLQAPQRAASYNQSILGGGDFKPEQLVAALKSEMPSKRFAAADDAALQDAIAKFQEIGGRKTALKEAQAKRANELSLTQKRNLSAHEKFVNDLKLAKGESAETIKGAAEQTTRGVKEAVGDVGKASEPSSTQKRLGFLMAGAPMLKALTLGGLGSVSAPVLAQTAGLATIPGALTRLGYTNQMQALKNLATKPRSAEMKAAAERVRQSVPAAGGLGGYLASPNAPVETQTEEE